MPNDTKQTETLRVDAAFRKGLAPHGIILARELERECAQLRAELEYVREFLHGEPIRHALTVDGITLDEYICAALARSGAK